jgi:hypothetical protein
LLVWLAYNGSTIISLIRVPADVWPNTQIGINKITGPTRRRKPRAACRHQSTSLQPTLQDGNTMPGPLNVPADLWPNTQTDISKITGPTRRRNPTTHVAITAPRIIVSPGLRPDVWPTWGASRHLIQHADHSKPLWAVCVGSNAWAEARLEYM